MTTCTCSTVQVSAFMEQMPHRDPACPTHGDDAPEGLTERIARQAEEEQEAERWDGME